MINLLPPKVKENHLYGRRNVALLSYSATLLATAMLTAGIMYGSLQFIGSDESDLTEEIKSAQTDITALEAQIKPIESVATRLETAKKIADQSVSFSELIPKIGAVLPNGVVLNALSLTGGATDPLQLDVDMTNANLAAVMIRNLVESDLFEAADIASLTPKATSEEEGDNDSGSTPSPYQFNASITASFTGTADAKRKAAAAEKAAADAAKANAAAAGGTQQ
jgi:Tfp pilus assembly protein PilN